MSQLSVDSITGRSEGSAPSFPNGAVVTGVVTATSFAGDVNGTATVATTLSSAANITTGTISNDRLPATITKNIVGSVTGDLTGNIVGDTQVGGALTVTGNLTVQGTTTTIDTATLIIEDKNIGIGSVTTPTNDTADGGGITIFGGSDGDKTLTWEKESTYFTFSDGIDIPGAVETIGTASTSETGVAGNVCLTLDAKTGTVFEHNIGLNGSVGIVSLTNFPGGSVKEKSGTTFTVLFTQTSTLAVGVGNTLTSAGIGTNITLKPYGQVAIANTEAKVATGSTVTLSSTASDVDFVTFFVRSGTASTVAYVTSNGSFRY